MHGYIPCAACWWLIASKPPLNRAHPLSVFKPPSASALMATSAAIWRSRWRDGAGHFIRHHFLQKASSKNADFALLRFSAVNVSEPNFAHVASTLLL